MSREILLADLREESLTLPPRRRRWWVYVQVIRITAWQHAEGYRDVDDRWRVLALFGLAGALCWSVPAATAQAFGASEMLVPAPMRTVMAFWQAPHITAAIAVGLVTGRLPIVPSHAEPVRAHVAVSAMVASVVSYGWPQGMLAAACLMMALWLGSRNRGASAPPSPAVCD